MDDALRQRLFDALVGKPLVGNAFRGTLVEAIIAQALEPEWRWCADGWGSFDFEGPKGMGLEVKQSAARQNWHGNESRPCTPRFDIAERTGFWDEQSRWTKRAGRAAAGSRPGRGGRARRLVPGRDEAHDLIADLDQALAAV